MSIFMDKHTLKVHSMTAITMCYFHSSNNSHYNMTKSTPLPVTCLNTITDAGILATSDSVSSFLYISMKKGYSLPITDNDSERRNNISYITTMLMSSIPIIPQATATVLDTTSLRWSSASA